MIQFSSFALLKLILARKRPPATIEIEPSNFQFLLARKPTTPSQKKAAANKKQGKLKAEENRQGSKTPHKTRPELMAKMIARVFLV